MRLAKNTKPLREHRKRVDIEAMEGARVDHRAVI
jgi:hypothetical protein